jgi:microcystin-dependent protein
LLTLAEMWPHTHSATISSAGDHAHSSQILTQAGGSANLPVMQNGSFYTQLPTTTAGAHVHSMTIDTQGSGWAHANVQPTAILNKIIKASAT